MKSKRGFTLIEILVTITIIGVLAATALTSYLWVSERGRSAEAKEVLFKAFAGYQRAVIEELGYGPGNPWSWARLGMSDPNSNTRRYFNYTVSNNWNVLNTVRAERRGDNSKWLEIDLASGALTKSTPY